MADNPNLATLERAYERWGRTKGGNVDEILDLFRDDVEMRSVLVPDVPSDLSGIHAQREQAAAYFEALLRDWEMLYFDVDRYIADGDDIVMVGRMGWRNRATGNEVHSPKVDIWQFRDGKVVSFFELFDSLGFAQAIGAVPSMAPSAVG